LAQFCNIVIGATDRFTYT